MKLDRNINSNGQGKYALLNLRMNTIEWGNKGNPDEFFVIKLKDKHSGPALTAYADSIRPIDPEFAAEVMDMVRRTRVMDQKQPD